ncbi:DNA replication licensing factor MCM5 [Gossypium australe]|uniref:DNA replication licensing factor MCM5 n=1 Tax=Gossypium australe TaxID=47621 RepID=A0A5B6WWA5_9ROSI|nr:DNA replication licensing factor MCM5 [Gossypium australe]
MSGWDEGAVYYSNQAQFTEASSEAEAAAASTTASRHSVLLKFKEFIRNFEKEKNVFPYRESLVNNPKFLMVHLEDLLSFDSDLPSLLRSSPSDYLPLFETAAAEVLAGLKMKVAGDSGEMVEPQKGEVQILLTSKEDPVSMRSLGAQYISKLVKISGITIAASRIKAKATYVHLICKNCKSARAVPCRPGLGGAIVPRSCDHVPQPGEEPCPIDPWLIVPDKSKYVDQQTLKLQENPEDVPTGELPRNMLLSVDRHLVQTIVPGSRLTIMGIYSIFQASNSSTNHKGAVAVRQPYIRIVGMEETNEASSRGPATFTQEEVEEFKKFASNQDTYEAICSKVAPSIFGHEDVKKAVACLLFGGARKNLPDGVKLRGDINVLLLGDPSTAKSQFLKFVEKTAPIAVYTSGKGSSAAGLTASVIRDSSSVSSWCAMASSGNNFVSPISLICRKVSVFSLCPFLCESYLTFIHVSMKCQREFYLEGGAMVLADGGVVCIDEFDKMRPEDRVAIHEAMEQQTISIAKAGITTVLNSRTSVLAAANPPSGRYDDLKTAQDNIDLQTTILSRFDLIFIVKDIRMYDQDKTIASHIIKVHASAQTVSNDSRTSKEENWLKRYIQYCRSECHPRLSEAACAKLQSDYVDIRRGMRQQANETGESAAIPITVRQLEAIIRLSEALAKMKLSHVATECDVAEALRLFKVSTMDAARSGINQHINITPDMANEIKQSENQIKRRLGIGNRISERRLIDDLTRMGMNESIVRRAILIMHQRGEVEYQRERHIIVRKV